MAIIKTLINSALGKDMTMPEVGGASFIWMPVSNSGKKEGWYFETLGKKWKSINNDYQLWYVSQTNFRPGFKVQSYPEIEKFVEQVMVYDGLKLQLQAVEKCLKEVVKDLKYYQGSLHMKDDFYQLEGVNDLVKKYITDDKIALFLY